MRFIAAFCDAGSSPRVRGTPAELAGSAYEVRFIPACAGNSKSPVAPTDAAGGSSPRVRGTRVLATRLFCVHRFIPACAGNSGRRPAIAKASAVHPRVCGELEVFALRPRDQAGSSPRVRGTPPPNGLGRAPERFIPACAGNSCAALSAASWTTVHPRVCGELTASRGREAHQGRFIPACAGNSRRRRHHHQPNGGSSPRVRGTR